MKIITPVKNLSSYLARRCSLVISSSSFFNTSFLIGVEVTTLGANLKIQVGTPKGDVVIEILVLDLMSKIHKKIEFKDLFYFLLFFEKSSSVYFK